MSDRCVFAPLGASNHTKEERQPEDLYVTDPKAVEALLAVEDFDRRIWEPCVGLGHISGVLEKHGHEVRKSDIIDRIGNEELDFLSCVEGGRVGRRHRYQSSVFQGSTLCRKGS